MNYNEWNKLLCEYYFESDDSGQDIFLHITQDDIVKFVKNKTEYFTSIYTDFEKIKTFRETQKVEQISFDDFIISNFLSSFKCKTKFEFLTFLNSHITEGRETSKPTFIGCITVMILPLLEYDKFYGQDFYGPLNTFFKEKHLIRFSEKIQTQDLSALKPSLNDMWDFLASWANSNMFSYKRKKFNSFRNEYAKPFISETLFSTNKRDRFKTAFIRCGLSLDEELTDDEIMHYLSNTKGYLMGYSDKVWGNLLKDYPAVFVKEFRNAYMRWDGTSRIIKREKGKDIIEDYGTIYPMFLGFRTLPGNQLEFFLEVFSRNSENCQNLTFSTPDNPELNLYITSSGYGSSHIALRNIYNIVSQSQELTFNEVGNKENKAIFKPSAIYLFERSHKRFTSNSKLRKGDSYYFLISNELLPEYQNWINENNAKEILIDSFNGFTFYYFEKIETSYDRNSRLKIENQISVRSTLSLTIYSDYKETVFSNLLSAHFEITGIDISSAKVYALSDDRRYKTKLEYDPERQLWTLKPFTNVFQAKKAFTIFIDDSCVSFRNYRFAEHLLPNVDEYKSLIRNEYGFEDNAGLLKGLTLPFARNTVNFECLKLSMNNCKELPSFMRTEHPVQYFKTDYILYAISSRLTIERSEFGEIIKLLEIEGERTEPLSNVINNYDRLGFINYNYKEGQHHIAVNPPTLVLIPPLFRKEQSNGLWIFAPKEKLFKCLLTGARTPKLIDEILKKVPALEIHIEFDNNKNTYLPQTIFLWSENVNSFTLLANSLKIEFQKIVYAKELLSLMPDITNYFEQLVKDEYYKDFNGVSNNIFSIDYKKLSEEFSKGGYISNERIKKYSINEDVDIVTYSYKTKDEETIFWYKGNQFSIDKYWGHFIGMWKSGEIKVLKINNNEFTIDMPMQIKFPQLYARALTMLTGHIPKENHGQRSYEIINNPFANNVIPEEILKKLKQN